MNQKILHTLLLLTVFVCFASLSCKQQGVDRAEQPNPAIAPPPPPPPQAQLKPEPIDPLAQFDRQKSKQLTALANFLAGMPVENNPEIAALTNTSTWQNRAAFANNAWQQLETKQLAPARKWSATELKTANALKTDLFYPFSGPDFLYAYTFFPTAKQYIFVGLEPIGNLPTLPDSAQLSTQLQSIDRALYDVLQMSFFQTNAMRQDLQVKGVLPILYVFLARTNNIILDVQYVGLDKAGKLNGLFQLAKPESGLLPGVKISFVPKGETEPRTLYYFAVDLSDRALDKTPEFIKFIERYPAPITYLKAASYLLHREKVEQQDTFTQMRSLILTRSSHLLQDDSGIPVRYFDPNKWDRKFYGNYIQPIDLFSVRDQPDLRKIYQDRQNMESLGFGIGYKYDRDSNLMLATPKK
jgi:hypothetical protein